MDFTLAPLSTENYLDSTSLPDLLTSVLLFASAPLSNVEAIFTNLSLEPTWRWYFAMTPFETVFLFLVIGQFALLNTLGIMPMNLSNLINGMPSGRKKREVTSAIGVRRDIGIQILNLLKRLDPNECTFRVICEIQSNYLSKPDWNLSDETKLVLTSLKKSGERRCKRNDSTDPESRMTDSIEDFENAVEAGYRSYFSETTTNSTVCQQKYHSCPSTSQEIFDFVKIIGKQNFSL